MLLHLLVSCTKVNRTTALNIDILFTLICEYGTLSTIAQLLSGTRVLSVRHGKRKGQGYGKRMQYQSVMSHMWWQVYGVMTFCCEL